MGEHSLGWWVAHVFNRTALGAGVLIGVYWLWQGNLWRAVFVFLVLLPLYFFLHDRLDAP